MADPMALSALLPAVAAWLDLTAGPISGVFKVYTHDTLPATPAPPYACLYDYPTGYGWDAGMLNGDHGTAGWVGVTVSGVGLADRDAQVALDRVRVQMSRLEATVHDPSWPTPGIIAGLRLASVRSEGPPSAPERAGTLSTVTETFLLYVEAP